MLSGRQLARLFDEVVLNFVFDEIGKGTVLTFVLPGFFGHIVCAYDEVLASCGALLSYDNVALFGCTFVQVSAINDNLCSAS